METAVLSKGERRPLKPSRQNLAKQSTQSSVVPTGFTVETCTCVLETIPFDVDVAAARAVVPLCRPRIATCIPRDARCTAIFRVPPSSLATCSRHSPVGKPCASTDSSAPTQMYYIDSNLGGGGGDGRGRSYHGRRKRPRGMYGRPPMDDTLLGQRL